MRTPADRRVETPDAELAERAADRRLRETAHLRRLLDSRTSSGRIVRELVDHVGRGSWIDSPA